MATLLCADQPIRRLRATREPLPYAHPSCSFPQEIPYSVAKDGSGNVKIVVPALNKNFSPEEISAQVCSPINHAVCVSAGGLASVL